MAAWPQCVTLVSAQKHTFVYRTGIFSALFVHIFPIVAYQRSFGVLKSGVDISIASLFSGNLSHSQNIIFAQMNLLILKKYFLFPHPSPQNCLISDEPHWDHGQLAHDLES